MYDVRRTTTDFVFSLAAFFGTVLLYFISNNGVIVSISLLPNAIDRARTR